MTDTQALRVLVLAGGPDRERDVSLASGAAVSQALRDAGHEVHESDIGPDDLTALDALSPSPGSVIFPVLHGPWGEGGGLQAILDKRGLQYVGSRAPAARLCMDKAATKRRLVERGLPTPAFEVCPTDAEPTIDLPLVLKPLCEGSSIDLHICRSNAEVAIAMAALRPRHEMVLAEAFVTGMELTVAVISSADGSGLQPLPPIRIVPAVAFYDYQAKYHREDTQYLLDPGAIGLAPLALAELVDLAVKTHEATDCRHLSRVDFMLDDAGRPWVLEINTLPGFTSHSLLPKAAAHAGITMPMLVDRLVRLAARRR